MLGLLRPLLLISIAVIAGIVVIPSASEAAPGDVGYEGRSFSGTGTPTGIKRGESILWWNDGFWWAHMWDTASQDFHIMGLDLATQTWQDTGTTVETRANTHSDVLWDGAHLYVASHQFVADEQPAVSGYPSYLFRFSYNTVSNTYTADSGFPVQINNMRTETLVIDKDSTGKLWATWQQGNQIYLNRTNGSDQAWGTPFAFPHAAANVTVDDNSSIIPFGGNKMGLMWSNQGGSNYAMHFAFHQDGAPDGTWSAPEQALSGSNTADDHINLKSLQADGSGRVFAATKTSNTSSSTALIMMLVRTSTGSWGRHPIALVSDCPNRPLVLLDEQNNVLHTFYTAPAPPNYTCTSSGGAIYKKTSPLNSVSFGPGRGTPVIVDADSPYLHDVSSTKQNLNASTGLVVLAANTNTSRYWHHYEALPGSPPGSPPVANFTGSPTSGSAPLTVAFTDTSTNSPTSWSWTFGDGGTSTARNPSHTYAAAGTYSVSLTATNALGSNTLTRTNYITVTPPIPPVANFSGSPTSGVMPLTVAFTDTSTGSPASWSWTFGDGGTSTTRNPSHTYTTAGTYTVTLQVTNAAASNTLTRTNYITVTPPPPPVANFSGSPTSGVIPLTVAFTDTSTNSPTSWSWNFGDGGTSTARNPSHTYTVAGTYTVTLQVANAGGTNTLTRTNYITATPPPPDFTVSASPAKQTVHQGGSTSYQVALTSLHGFSGPVTLSVTGLPSGASGSFSPNPVTVSSTSSSTLLITTTPTTQRGGRTLTIRATSGGLTHTTTVTLQVRR
jgi:PKD repeat protein